MRAYFANLRNTVKQIEGKVLSDVRNSQSLQELELILDENKEYFNENRIDNFKDEKVKFDEKIAQGKYTNIVSWKDYYDNMIDKMNDTV